MNTLNLGFTFIRVCRVYLLHSDVYCRYHIIIITIKEVTVDIVRIYNECEGRIEKSVPMLSIWHHEACRVMTNDDLEGPIFLSYPHTNNGFFFLLTTSFFLFQNKLPGVPEHVRYNFTC